MRRKGWSGYDSAIQLGLRSLVADEPVKGEISIATTGAGDPASFARVQAGTLDPAQALAEAYRRNNSGSYAEAAEFFAAVSKSDDAPLGRAEALANEALQKSNLGRFAEADSLFAKASEQVGADPMVARRLRNYRAIHDLNQGNPKEALEELAKPLPAASAEKADGTGKGSLNIDRIVAKRLNSESKIGQQLGSESDELLPAEKAEILDGQALQLRGTSLRLTGDMAGATTALHAADAMLQSVRAGRVASIVWMRAQILGDLAAIAEETHNAGEADRLYPPMAWRCSKSIIRARRRCLTPRRDSRAISPAQGSSRPRKRCSARSSTRRAMPATSRHRSHRCFGPTSTCFSRRAMTRTPTPKSFRRLS